MKRLLNLFLAGITAILPIGITIFILYKLFMIVDSFSAGFINKIVGERIVGIGFLTTIGFIILVGFITKYYLGEKLIEIIEKAISKIPIAQSIYSSVKEVSKMIPNLGVNNKKFNKVVIIDFPNKDIKSIGFITNDNIQISNSDRVAVFVPTTPNPTNGFLIYVDKDSVEVLDITIDEAIKSIISMGAITPDILKNKRRI
ncbi:DUF502 domain-containing protein [Clostridium aestuarii]|uniref:DUF502 domain-containing protein n=1 Tax=Clostridium aestuarii TaxID=338193 RepID=A0ABT4CWP7_9CLOT|nr:DUF502 domain-containing protein [Clostridium aestuarii]MCY6483419.1 DUF502 domain-containing protein [Clostridium aestuarii]